MNDMHPANSWCNTVASFESSKSTFSILTREGIKKKDVLWVRFGEREPGFDYGALGKQFTYVDRSTSWYSANNDFSNKSPQYPVVVIEGLPYSMERREVDGEHESGKKGTWSSRDELCEYIDQCSCFLYFVCHRAQGEAEQPFDIEIRRIVSALSAPINPSEGGTKNWSVFVKDPDCDSSQQTLSVDAPFAAKDTPETLLNDSEAIGSKANRSERGIFLRFPVTIESFAISVGKPSDVLLQDLADIGIKVTGKTRMIAPSAAARLCEKYGLRLRSNEELESLHLRFPPTVESIAAETGVRGFTLVKELQEFLGRLILFREPLPTDVAISLCKKHGFALSEKTADA